MQTTQSQPASPDRRRFIRIAGGGVVAAAIPMTGCTSISNVPSSAVAAWQSDSLPQEYREWILAHAILAPNPHNRQPWLVDLSEPDVITLSIDTQRLLPHTDPFGRQIIIGTGAMIGLLELAASNKGYSTTVSYIGNEATDRPPDGKPLLRVELAPAESTDTRHAELFDQIRHRHTERGNYNPKRAVPIDFQQILPTLLAEGSQGMLISNSSDSETFNALSNLVKQAWYTELATPVTMMESMNLLRVGSKEIDRYRDGIVIDSLFLVLLDKFGMFDRSKPAPTDSRVFKQQIDDFNLSIDSTPAFYIQTSTDNSRWSQLQAGRSYVKTQLLATQFGLTMHPVSQGLQEYPEVKTVYTDMHALANDENQTTNHTVQMLTRIGYPSDDAKPSGPSPRRGLQAHLV